MIQYNVIVASSGMRKNAAKKDAPCDIAIIEPLDVMSLAISVSLNIMTTGLTSQ